MKYLITADIHINFNKNKDWELDRFNQYVGTLKRNKENADVLILAGDIFDKPQPSLQEIQAFYDMLREVKGSYQKVVLIAGNHERVNKDFTTFDYIPRVYFEYAEDVTFRDGDFLIRLLGHNKLYQLEQSLKNDKNILISHFRSDLGVIGEEIDVEYVSSTYDYCIVGDIHQHYFPYSNVEYTSQPYNTTYKEAKENGYIILEINKGKYQTKYISIDLPNKIKVELSAEEYLEQFDFLSKSDNLYKVVIVDEADNMKDLPIADNIVLSFKSKAYVRDKEQDEEIKQEIKQKGFIDIPETLKRLVRDSGQLEKEEDIRVGENLVDMIVKGVV